MQDLPKSAGFTSQYLQAEYKSQTTVLSFHFSECTEYASYSTDPWRNVRYLCGNILRHYSFKKIRNCHACLFSTPLLHSAWVQLEMIRNIPGHMFLTGTSELRHHPLEQPLRHGGKWGSHCPCILRNTYLWEPGEKAN